MIWHFIILAAFLYWNTLISNWPTNGFSQSATKWTLSCIADTMSFHDYCDPHSATHWLRNIEIQKVCSDILLMHWSNQWRSAWLVGPPLRPLLTKHLEAFGLWAPTSQVTQVDANREYCLLVVLGWTNQALEASKSRFFTVRFYEYTSIYWV